MNKKRILAGLISCPFILSSCVKYDKSWETVPTTERAPLPELDLPEEPEEEATEDEEPEQENGEESDGP